MQIILDISANTHKNSIRYFTKMIKAIKEVDNKKRKKHAIIIKGQLFTKAGDNIPQGHYPFAKMVWTCNRHGYKATASVFDKWCLNFLLTCEPQNIGTDHYALPFIKIANNPECEWLIGEVPRRIPVFQSVPPEVYWSGEIGDAAFRWQGSKLIQMLCVSKYPAEVDDYGSGPGGTAAYALSDHTVGLDLLWQHEPEIWEKHFKLEDSTGLDAGPWAITPKELREVLNDVHW